MENKNYLFQHYPLEYYGSDNGLLGSGTFGEVKLYINPITQKQYAVKFETNLQVASYLKEVSQLISFEHPNILKIYDAGFFKTIIERKIKYTFYSVLELAESDFAVFISKYPYRENKLLIKKLMFDTALGLAHLASKNIIHGDIKVNNILIVRDKGQYIAKIADLDFLMPYYVLI